MTAVWLLFLALSSTPVQMDGVSRGADLLTNPQANAKAGQPGSETENRAPAPPAVIATPQAPRDADQPESANEDTKNCDAADLYQQWRMAEGTEDLVRLTEKQRLPNWLGIIVQALATVAAAWAAVAATLAARVAKTAAEDAKAGIAAAQAGAAASQKAANASLLGVGVAQAGVDASRIAADASLRGVSVAERSLTESIRPFLSFTRTNRVDFLQSDKAASVGLLMENHGNAPAIIEEGFAEIRLIRAGQTLPLPSDLDVMERRALAPGYVVLAAGTEAKRSDIFTSFPLTAEDVRQLRAKEAVAYLLGYSRYRSPLGTLREAGFCLQFNAPGIGRAGTGSFTVLPDRQRNYDRKMKG